MRCFSSHLYPPDLAPGSSCLRGAEPGSPATQQSAPIPKPHCMKTLPTLGDSLSNQECELPEQKQNQKACRLEGFRSSWDRPEDLELTLWTVRLYSVGHWMKTELKAQHSGRAKAPCLDSAGELGVDCRLNKLFLEGALMVVGHANSGACCPPFSLDAQRQFWF